MSKVFSEALVLRFSEYHEVEQLKEDMRIVLEASKIWEGTPVPTFLVFLASPTARYSPFSFGHDYVEHPDFLNRIGFLPLDYAGIHAATFRLKWASSLRIEQNFNADDSVPDKPRRFTKAEPPEKPIDPRNMPPELRFLMTRQAMEEGEDFYKEMTFYGPSMHYPHQAWMREQVIARLGERWPSIGRADRILGGLITEALEAVAAEKEFPRWWLSLPIALMKGNGLAVESTCREIIARRSAAKDEDRLPSPQNPQPKTSRMKLTPSSRSRAGRFSAILSTKSPYYPD